MNKYFADLNCILIILLFSLLGMKSLFYPGLFTAHDIGHQVTRMHYYLQSINDHQFPPYWVGQLANNFGYPLFIFSYQLPWIIGALLIKSGLSIANSLKILFFLSYFSSGITMYFLVKTILNNKLSALLSSILYLWLPYHFLIIFVGASMGIAFIFAFLPLVFLGIHLIRKRGTVGIPILALGTSGVILSHIMHLIFSFPIILIFFFWELISSNNKMKFLTNICLGIILSILISAFYIIPASYYNQSTRVHLETGFSQVYKRNFVNLNQLIYSKWGYGPIINNAKNGENSFQLGIAQWLSIIFLMILLLLNKLPKMFKSLGIVLLVSFILNIFLMLDLANPIWKFVTKYVSIDFPYRILLPTALVSSICAGFILMSLNKRLQYFLLISLIFISLYTNRNHINVNQHTNLSVINYLDLETEKTTNTYNEYLPIHADASLLNKPWNEVEGQNTTVSNLKKSTNSLSFDLTSKTNQTISIGQFYFPGQTLYVNNINNEINIDKKGRISFFIPQGTHTIKLQYQETRLIEISKLLTISGLIITTLLLIRQIYCTATNLLYLSRKNFTLNKTILMQLIKKYCPKSI